MSTAKYRVGDIVSIINENNVSEVATVLNVYSGLSSETVYLLEGENKRKIHVVESEILGFILTRGRRGCECGAHRMVGNEDCHSHWCPAFKGPNEGESKWK